MIDHSRSNRIIKAAHDRGDIKPLAAAHRLRERLRASGDSNLVFLGEALTDEWLDMLLQNAAKDRNNKAH